jgi:hypothetical protein
MILRIGECSYLPAISDTCTSTIKEERCLEYALYQRELEEVAEALEEIEEERKEFHGANQRRELFSEREQQIQVLLLLVRTFIC